MKAYAVTWFTNPVYQDIFWDIRQPLGLDDRVEDFLSIQSAEIRTMHHHHLGELLGDRMPSIKTAWTASWERWSYAARPPLSSFRKRLNA